MRLKINTDCTFCGCTIEKEFDFTHPSLSDITATIPVACDLCGGRQRIVVNIIARVFGGGEIKIVENKAQKNVQDQSCLLEEITDSGK